MDYYGLEGWQDEEFELDEKTMTDLHLGSAINLDHVEFLLTGQFSSYNIYIPHFQRIQWGELRTISMNYENSKIGLLDPTQEILLFSSEKSPISQSVYKSVVSIIGRSLEKSKIMIPISKYWKELSKEKIYTNTIYMGLFRMVLKVCCMVSEASRGGDRSHYQGIEIRDRFVRTEFQFKGLHFRITANNSFCAIDDKINKISHYGTFESLLLIMDTLGQRICLDIGCQVARIGKMDGVPSNDVLKNIMRIGDIMLKTYGNNGYEFIAMFEALVVSTILKKNPDKITNKDEFFGNCRGEVEEMVNDGLFKENVLSLFDSMSAYLISLSNGMLSNIFCIYRIWGHPRVNIKEGMKKVMEKGTAQKKDSNAMADLVLFQFRKMFLTEFYNVHHSYPPCLFTDETTYISQCIRDEFPINVDSPRYCIYDFQSVEIEKLWELPETYDVCHILNDRSVSPNRSELFKSVRSGKGTVNGVQRRGIIRWLMSESIRCKEFLNEVDQNGLDEDSLIIGMYEKEREIKIKARMFSLMSEKMRMYFVLTEEMISDHLLKYFPQITMKDPLHVQLKKLWNVSGTSNKECIDPIINIDFEKWNLNMREQFTLPLFRQMDKLFGYNNLISRTHSIFVDSLIYSCSGKYLPLVTSEGFQLDPPMCYIGHQGGFEGLRQKGWTIATVCLLCFIADKLRLKINLLGQGDNQVIRIYMPHSYWENLRMDNERRVGESKRLLEEFLQSMYNHFDEAGLPIKSRETWKSTRLYMYGKNMYLDGNSLPQWTKKLLRSYALSNEGTLTISGVIGTIATNMCAAANVSEKPDIMYVVYLILAEWSLEFLFSYHPFTRKTLREGEEIEFYIASSAGRKRYQSERIMIRRLIATIMLIPTSVGGSITIPLLGFIIRGFPDNASEGYSWLKLLYGVDSEFKDLFKSWYGFLCNETKEYDMLIQSPWSLNHKKPPTPGMHSRDTVRDFILSGEFKRNTFISRMQESLTGFNRKKISKALMGKRVNPLILNEIYNSFPQYLDQVLRRIENTRTIKKMTLKVDTRTPIVSKLMQIENEFLGYLHWRGLQTNGIVFSECSTEHCRVARNRGWECEIKGLTTPHPIEFLFSQVCDDFSKEFIKNDYIFVKRDENGEFPPYLGSNVKTKVVSLQDIAVRSEPLVSTAAKLLRYSKWLNLGENSNKLINANIEVVCNTSIFENLGHDVESFYTGCVEHRFNPSSASEGCFINYAPQIGKRVFLSSDCMPRYGRGQTNYTIHFQAMYCLIQYVASEAEGRSFKHYHLSCEDCIQPVDDEVDDIGDMSEILEKLYDEEKKNLLRETLGYLNIRVETFQDRIEPKIRSIPIANSADHNIGYIKEGIHCVLACMAATMIMYAPRDTPDSIGESDLQTFPRIYAYKVSSRKIMEYTADYLFVIKASRMSEELIDVRHFFSVKDKLVSHLMKMPLSKFKGLGTLMIGRTWNKEDESPLMLNLGEFPENPTTFLNSVRAEIVGIIENRCSVQTNLKRSQLPVLGISDKAIKICLTARLISTYQCVCCCSNGLKWLRSSDEFLDCPNKHMLKTKKRNIGVNIPMDLAMKMIGTLSCSEDPLEVFSIQSEDIEMMRKIRVEKDYLLDSRTKLELKSIVRSIKRNMRVLLPTSALYKWDHLLSCIGKLDFDSVLVFGDGTGFTSLAAARRFTSSIIYPTGIIERKRLIPQDLMSLRPFASRRYTNVSTRLLQEVPDDILDEVWGSSMRRFLNTLEGKVLILSDVESITWEAKKLFLRLWNLVSEVPQDITLIQKIYLGDWRDSPQNWEIYMSPFGNIQHLECFASNVSLGGIEESFSEVISKDSLKEWIDEVKLAKMVFDRDTSYFEAVEASRKISIHVFNRNMIPLSQEDLELPACAMIYKVLLYISNNFKPPSVVRFRSDRRVMLDGTLVKIIKGTKMLLIALYGQEVMERDYFHRLHITKASKSDRTSGIKELNVLFSMGIEEHDLSQKEEKAAFIIRQEWVQLHRDREIPGVPLSIFKLYTDEIIPGKSVFRELKH
ncbi:TPA_asm: polyprotein [Raphanus virus 1]|uniref:RNA-directed RNA polymerase n=1 Tax=Raphanus virus 1 TaxID=2977984 RepID=A0A9N7AB12_9RHAB|nr:TPA_asm: polyprotein [Raphanus virus 1]